MHLEATAVREYGAVPCVEAVQPARMLQHFHTRTQVQVVGVAEHDRRIEVVAELTGVHGLHGAERAHGHEHGGGDGAVVGVQYTGPCVGGRVVGQKVESEGHGGR